MLPHCALDMPSALDPSLQKYGGYITYSIIQPQRRRYVLQHNNKCKKLWTSKSRVLLSSEFEYIMNVQHFLTLSKEIKDWHLAVAIFVIVAIVVVITSFGFIISAFRPTAHIASDGEHQPMENVSNVPN